MEDFICFSCYGIVFGSIGVVVKNLLRKLNYEVGKRENLTKFAIQEFYFPTEQEEIENLEVGETQVSITAQLHRE